jgi:hypothetical protein
MELPDAIVIDLMQPEWRRWMIHSMSTRRYWGNGKWHKRRRDGELWNSKAEAEQEVRIVRMGS